MSNFFENSEIQGSLRFADLLGAYESRVYVAALALTGSQERAETVLSDVFTRLYRTCEQLPSNFCPLPYISELLIESCVRAGEEQHCSRVSQIPFADFEIECLSTETPAMGFRAVRPVILRGLSSLPVEYRQVILLKEFFKNDYSDCAAILDVEPAVARSLHRRACLMLRRVLRREDISQVSFAETASDELPPLFSLFPG